MFTKNAYYEKQAKNNVCTNVNESFPFLTRVGVLMQVGESEAGRPAMGLQSGASGCPTMPGPSSLSIVL